MKLVSVSLILAFLLSSCASAPSAEDYARSNNEPPLKVAAPLKAFKTASKVVIKKRVDSLNPNDDIPLPPHYKSKEVEKSASSRQRINASLLLPNKVEVKDSDSKASKNVSHAKRLLYNRIQFKNTLDSAWSRVKIALARADFNVLSANIEQQRFEVSFFDASLEPGNLANRQQFYLILTPLSPQKTVLRVYKLTLKQQVVAASPSYATKILSIIYSNL